MLLTTFIEPYLSYCRVERLVADSTLAKYRDCFRSWIDPVLGCRPIGSLQRADVSALRTQMVARRLSIGRQYGVLVCLKGLLKYCRHIRHLVTLDPSEITLPARPKPYVEYLTNDEVQCILGSINTHTFSGARLRALVELLLGTGMRISEALSLDRQPFDAQMEELEIVGKGLRRRSIFLSDRVRGWITSYLAKRLDDHPALFVTTGYPAARFRREDVSRFFILLRRKTGITKHLTPHLLRHTFCTNLRDNGADITLIRDLAGHSDIQTTAKYYLGIDKAVLKQVVADRLGYGLPGERPRAA